MATNVNLTEDEQEYLWNRKGKIYDEGGKEVSIPDHIGVYEGDYDFGAFEFEVGDNLPVFPLMAKWLREVNKKNSEK